VIKSGKKRWVRHVKHLREMRYAYKILIKKSDRKIPCG
jgi:hypothetical protein